MEDEKDVENKTRDRRDVKDTKESVPIIPISRPDCPMCGRAMYKNGTRKNALRAFICKPCKKHLTIRDPELMASLPSGGDLVRKVGRPPIKTQNCKVCGSKHYAIGLCAKCYRQQYRQEHRIDRQQT